MEDITAVHIDNLPPAILDLKDALEDIRDELGGVQNALSEMAELRAEVTEMRRVLARVVEALDPLHHLSAISDTLNKIARHGL
jgi:Mg2+ and Co2+ transporter CorA